MSRASIATPCPAPPFASSHLPIPVAGRRSSTAALASDDTTELEYTRAIQVEFKNAKPRRKSTFQRRERREAAVTIFEDVLEDEELIVPSRNEVGGSTLLGKPAQRIRGHANLHRRETKGEQTSAPVAGDAQRRSSMAVQPPIAREDFGRSRALNSGVSESNGQEKLKGGLTKEPRRRTIFVPAEDTTILTIHPGANSTERLNDTFQWQNFLPPAPIEELNDTVAQTTQMPQPKRPRMSLAVAPKRIPLQHVAAKDANVPGADIAGQNGGKENMPPEGQGHDIDKKPVQVLYRRPARHSLASSKLFEPTAASRARKSIVTRDAVPLPEQARDAPTSQSTHSQNSPRHSKANSNIHARLSMRPSPPQHGHGANFRRASVQVSFADDHRSRSKPMERKVELQTARLQQYPVLTEDIAQPELYEDVWLSHQEVALTEVVNQIYKSAEGQSRQPDNGTRTLREKLIEIYHQPEVATIHKRLQASLLYGALSRPKDLCGPPNPAQDIGLRKRFLSLWLDGYETDILRVAAEVVFGRQLPKDSNGKRATVDGTIDPHRKRRALIGFLETFLIEVDDVEEPDEARGDDPTARWRKMILRSLMLVWLLDQAKQSCVLQGCLFKASSTRKSSVAMLHALAGMFIASIGDVTRVLRHLDYEVRHIQDPLDEVRYRIDNIAIDLRDGILLTRLVEVLLFSPNRLRIADTRGDATVTVHMPDFTILESALYDIDDSQTFRILSQHLKMPCLGRAQKVYNVQIAISALHEHGRLGESAENVTADDIVDGHREKTLSLLWSLVSNFGLEQLVDFKELTTDLKRAAGAAFDVQLSSDELHSLSQSRQESLLKKWASVHAMREGIRIGNLTTSFADGKAYAAILDAFSEYTKPDCRGPVTSNTSRLEAQLHAFGCSNAFIKQLASSSGTIPSRKTTLANLAFLASRLLPLARQHHSARTIQRAFRLRRSRSAVSKRVALMRLAHACATVVQTQDRLVSAAVVLQRAWRAVRDSRVQRLNAEVESFQAVAKGWMARRTMHMSLVGGYSGRQPLRTMGGW